MRKSVFSPRLFWESFKQMRIIGIMSTVILGAFAAIIPLGNYISGYKSTEIVNGVVKTVYNTTVVTALEIQPLIILTYTVIAPLLVLFAFQFLNNRNSSDFYHSIPQTRTCLFLSRYAACIAWIAGILLSSTAVSLLTTAILHNYFTVNYSTVFTSLFTVFCANILVGSAVAIAMTITGTLFNNVFVSVAILFVPRGILFTIYTLVTESIPFLSSGTLENFLVSPDINLAFGTLATLLGAVNYEDMLYNLGSGAYSLVMGLLFAAIALYGFNRRKSEVAGNAAASRRLSAVYRITLASVLSLLPCAYIFSQIVYDYNITGDTVFLIVVYYFIVVLAYALYELITSKKLSAMLRSLPGLLYVVLVNVLILFALFGYRSQLLNFTPTSNQITSINMIQTESLYRYGDNYVLDQAAEIDITDKKAIQIVSNSLAKATQMFKEDDFAFDKFFYADSNQRLYFRLNTKQQSGVRQIVLTADEYDYLMRALEENQEYKALFYNLPQKNVSIEYYSDAANHLSLSDAEREELYALYLQDIQEIPFEEQMDCVSGNAEANCGIFLIEFSKGSSKYTLELSVTDAHTRVAEYLNNRIYKTQAKDRSAIIDNLKTMEDFKFIYIAPHNIVNASGAQATFFNESGDDVTADARKAALSELAELLQNSPEKADPNGPYLDISVDTTVGKDGEIYYGTYFYRFALTENTLPEHLASFFYYEK
ncbi:MAG: hypothetical protein IJW78_03175 [Clostridia bacterium]|nr:hypothetical protein [Clostridia bacterium]